MSMLLHDYMMSDCNNHADFADIHCCERLLAVTKKGNVSSVGG